ncbi:GLPGLI family protein [Empedobacter stercoris]|uniref:GLPGLI family protein n=1 Tax=Empedobacter stercoris TaxID=1628248 RepID=UPI001CE20D53|nr:GLPGLI family protein [Empedobacter stercoris]MCA4777812.1 GLPGLI family protein [Empedobacter stercoris]
MKKIILLFILLFTSTSIIAQNHRFIYEYSFKIDSLNKENITKEIMNLDILKDGSNFYSNEKFTYDSLINAEFKKNEAIKSTNVDLSKIKNNSKVSFSVSKNYPKCETILHTSINGDKYAIPENEKINWIILPENSEIEGYKVQKAKTNIFGKNWIAWFTNDIQIQDGPYKFKGLPGLILKISDETDNHIFNFVGSKKLNFIPSKNDNSNEEKELIITGKKFNELWKEYIKDPAKKIKQIYASTDVSNITVTDANVKELTQSEVIRNKEQRVKDNLKKTNNFLELSLYK